MVAGLFLGLLLSLSCVLWILIRQRQENILNSTVIAATNCSVLVTDATGVPSSHRLCQSGLPGTDRLCRAGRDRSNDVDLDRAGYRSGLNGKACDGSPRWMGVSCTDLSLPQERHLILE